MSSEEEDNPSVNSKGDESQPEESEEEEDEITQNDNTKKSNQSPNPKSKTPSQTGSRPSKIEVPASNNSNNDANDLNYRDGTKPLTIRTKKSTVPPSYQDDNNNNDALPVKLPSELEKEQLLQSNAQLEINNQQLNQKLSKLKQSVVDIKSRLDGDIMHQLLIQKKKIKDLNNALKESNKTIQILQSQLKKKIQHHADITLYQTRYDVALRENSDIEELIALQDEEIKKYTLLNTKSSNDVMKKSSKIRQSEQDVTALKMAINESEQTIRKIQERIDKKNQEEKKRNDLIEDKNKEIAILMKFIESNKTQIALNTQNEQNLKNQIRKAKEETKHLNSVLNNTTNQRKNDEATENNIIVGNEGSFDGGKPVLNEFEEENNLKELAVLMKNVLNE